MENSEASVVLQVEVGHNAYVVDNFLSQLIFVF